jgi:hypothetical protein
LVRLFIGVGILRSIVDGDFIDVSKVIDDLDNEEVPTTTFFSTKEILVLFFL